MRKNYSRLPREFSGPSATRTSIILKVRNEVIREKMGVTQTILERMENNTYGHILRMEDNRWPKRIMTWSPEGIRIGKPEIKW
jgi:hypothetical protein